MLDRCPDALYGDISEFLCAKLDTELGRGHEDGSNWTTHSHIFPLDDSTSNPLPENMLI